MSGVYLSGTNPEKWAELYRQNWERVFNEPFSRATSVEQAEIVIVKDHTIYSAAVWLIRTMRNRFGGKKKTFILVRGEPRVVMPLNYGFWSQYYDLVISLGSLTSDGSEFLLPWPWRGGEHGDVFDSIEVADFSDQVEVNPKAGRNGVCMIAANKLGAVPGELYSLRKRACAEIEEIRLFGEGWKLGIPSKLLTYLKATFTALLAIAYSPKSSVSWFGRNPHSGGAVSSKLECLADYRVSVVIENSATYVSEKLFDAINAGTLPVYVGPDLSKVAFLEGLFIPANPTVESIRESIDTALAEDYDHFIARRREFLLSRELRAFAPIAVAERITRMVFEHRNRLIK